MASVRTYITETEFAKIDNPQSSTTYIVLDDNDPTLVKKVVFKTNNINNEGEVYIVQDEFPTPSGTINITANADNIDVKQYATANVNVPNPSTGSLEITSNNTYDVTDYAGVSVNVKGANDDLAYISGLNLSVYPTDTIETERFTNYPVLKSVNLSGITTIGESAFEDCTALTSLSNTEGIISCGANTFKGCTSLREISTPNMSTIPDGFCDGDPIATWNSDSITTTVGKNAFRGAKMASIDMTSMQSIDDGGFNYDLTNDYGEVSIKAPSTPPSLGTDSLPTPIKEIEVDKTEDIQTYTNDPDWAPYANKLVCYDQTIFHYDFVVAASESTTLNWATDASFTITTKNSSHSSCYTNDRFQQLYSMTGGRWMLRDSGEYIGLYNGALGVRGLGFRKLNKDDVVLVTYSKANQEDVEQAQYASTNSHLVISDSFPDGGVYKSLFLCSEKGHWSFGTYRANSIGTIDINPVGYYRFDDYYNLSDSSLIPSFDIDTTDTITLNGETLYKLTAGAWNGMYVSSNNISIGDGGLHIDDENGVTIGFKANSDYTYVINYYGSTGEFIEYNMTYDSDTGKYMIDDPTLNFGFHLNNASSESPVKLSKIIVQ